MDNFWIQLVLLSRHSIDLFLDFIEIFRRIMIILAQKEVSWFVYLWHAMEMLESWAVVYIRQ